MPVTYRHVLHDKTLRVSQRLFLRRPSLGGSGNDYFPILLVYNDGRVVIAMSDDLATDEDLERAVTEVDLDGDFLVSVPVTDDTPIHTAAEAEEDMRTSEIVSFMMGLSR